MKALYYDKKFVGIVANGCDYPDGAHGLCDAMSPDEGLAELVDIPVRLPPCQDEVIEDLVRAVVEAKVNQSDVFDEAVIDAKCREATAINNDGYAEQIEYLLGQIGPRAIQKLIDDE